MLTPLYTLVDIKQLLNKTILIITKTDDSIIFKTEDDEEYHLRHQQDCCESVYIEDVCGDLNDLIGSPILKAGMHTSKNKPFKYTKKHVEQPTDSYTWTFYDLRTIKGSVTIRFYGSSNGYYSETAELYKVVYDKPKQNYYN